MARTKQRARRSRHQHGTKNEPKESGVTIQVEGNHANPAEAKTFFNPVMSICREAVLSAVAAHVEGSDRATLRCLDAFGATGIAGLQWKRHLGAAVHVFINELSPVSVQNIVANCERNHIVVTRLHENGLSRQLGEPEAYHEEKKSVEVVQDDANVTMHRQQFNVVHIDPFGPTVQYLDALFRNIYHDGLAILTATDVASLYGKQSSLNALARNYGAYTLRTDYTREMAVRILLAEAARAAAKCMKGFDVLYCVAVEHFVQVGLRIKRGGSHANQAVASIHRYMHCVVCAEWGKLPNSNNPLEEHYQYLPCSCKEKSPGQTAFILGPMWSGNIMSVDFIREMQIQAKKLKLSKRISQILSRLEEESMCPNAPTMSATNQGKDSKSRDEHVAKQSKDSESCDQRVANQDEDNKSCDQSITNKNKNTQECGDKDDSCRQIEEMCLKSDQQVANQDEDKKSCDQSISNQDKNNQDCVDKLDSSGKNEDVCLKSSVNVSLEQMTKYEKDNSSSCPNENIAKSESSNLEATADESKIEQNVVNMDQSDTVTETWTIQDIDDTLAVAMVSSQVTQANNSTAAAAESKKEQNVERMDKSDSVTGTVTIKDIDNKPAVALVSSQVKKNRDETQANNSAAAAAESKKEQNVEQMDKSDSVTVAMDNKPAVAMVSSQVEKNRDEIQGYKRKFDVDSNMGAVKRQKTCRGYSGDDMPTFYYNLQMRQFKKMNIPRMSLVVSLLQNEGFRASRTHFDPRAVRTSASFQELKEVLTKYAAR